MNKSHQMAKKIELYKINFMSNKFKNIVQLTLATNVLFVFSLFVCKAMSMKITQEGNFLENCHPEKLLPENWFNSIFCYC